MRVVFKTIDLADGWARQRMTEAGREGELERVIVLLARVGRDATRSVARDGPPSEAVVVAVTNGRLDFGTWERVLVKIIGD